MSDSEDNQVFQGTRQIRERTWRKAKDVLPEKFNAL